MVSESLHPDPVQILEVLDVVESDKLSHQVLHVHVLELWSLLDLLADDSLELVTNSLSCFWVLSEVRHEGLERLLGGLGGSSEEVDDLVNNILVAENVRCT